MDTKDIKPGSKVDLRMLQEVNRKDGSKGVGTYMSSVFDLDANGNFILHMPTQGGKILLLPLNVRYEFVFTTSGGLYKAEERQFLPDEK